MATPAQRKQLILFALSQLDADNGHFTFESICRHFAGLRICSNVLPATGPVAAGGDQGRDFESFRSYLREELGEASAFLGLVSEGPVVFLCTTQAMSLSGKIYSDVQKVLRSGSRPARLYAFTSRPLPIAQRHKLQQNIRRKFDIELDVLDGNAIAEHLASADTYWIADRYLNLPADLAPEPAQAASELPTSYVTLRDRCRSSEEIEPTWASLIDTTQGLRIATFNLAARPDLPYWLARIRVFLELPDFPPKFLQRARYELALATLRGTRNLVPVDATVADYFETVLNDSDGMGLHDAVVLLSYTATSVNLGVSNLSAEVVTGWQRALLAHVESLLKDASGPDRLMLLWAKGFMGISAKVAPKDAKRRGTVPDVATEEWQAFIATLSDGQLDMAKLIDVPMAIQAWTTLVAEHPKHPLFPLDWISDLVEVMTPLMVEQPGWRILTTRLDEAVGKLAGQNAVAERVRDRALALFRAGRIRLALNEAHEAKVNWWTGDSLHGSLLAMLFISRCYLRLKMPAAAKHYALGAAFIASRPDQPDDNVPLIAEGLLGALHADFVGGTWLDCLELAELTAAAQAQFVSNGSDIEENADLQQLVLDTAYASACAQAVSPEIVPAVNEIIAACGFQEVIEGLTPLNPMLDHEKWSMFATEELCGPPFSDLGTEPSFFFKGLGLSWTIRSTTDRDSRHAAGRLASAAQVLLVELADEDLCLLSTSIDIQVSLQNGHSQMAPIEAVPSNEGRQWKVRLMRRGADLKACQIQLLTVLSIILKEVSLLSGRDFDAAVERAFQRGLTHKLAAGRLYDDLCESFDGSRPATDAARLTPAPLEGNNLRYSQAVELAWQSGPGPGYSSDKAEEMLRNRYRLFDTNLKFTSEALRNYKPFALVVQELRARGWLDWHLQTAVMNIAGNYRVGVRGLAASWRNRPRMLELFTETETQLSEAVPPEMFDVASMDRARVIAMLSLARHWGLDVRQATPDVGAIEQALAQRYGYWSDDIAHADPYPSAV